MLHTFFGFNFNLFNHINIDRTFTLTNSAPSFSVLTLFKKIRMWAQRESRWIFGQCLEFKIKLCPVRTLCCFALIEGSSSHWVAITWCWADLHKITLKPFNLVFNQHTDLIFFTSSSEWTFLKRVGKGDVPMKPFHGMKLLSKFHVTQFRISSVRDMVSLNRSVHQVEINKQN